MRLRGKRWIYTVDGRTLRVENAWSFTLWAQERVVLDDVTLACAGGYFIADRYFRIPPQETGLAEPLNVSMYNGAWGIDCMVWLGERRLDAELIEHGRWHADRGCWPAANDATAPA